MASHRGNLSAKAKWKEPVGKVALLYAPNYVTLWKKAKGTYWESIDPPAAATG